MSVHDVYTDQFRSYETMPLLNVILYLSHLELPDSILKQNVIYPLSLKPMADLAMGRRYGPALQWPEHLASHF